MIQERKGATEAENLLEDLGFDSLPINPIVIARSINCANFKLVLEYRNFNSDKVLGKSEGNSKGALIYINKNIPDYRRSNFTVAHEIGHVCMHIMPERNLLFECGSEKLKSSFSDSIEKEANGFAAGLLMPKRLIKNISNGEINWRNISIISKHCKTSLEASYRRMSFLSETPSALVVHQNGRFRRFAASRSFDYLIKRSQLSKAVISKSVDIKQDKYPTKFYLDESSNWVVPKINGMKLELIYVSTILLKEGFTYSLLSYDEDYNLEANSFH